MNCLAELNSPAESDFDSAARFPAELHDITCCPVCHGDLRWESDRVRCATDSCGQEFAIADDTPILINEARSVFDVQAFIEQKPTFFKPISRWRELVSRCLPTLDNNVTCRRNFARLAELLRARRAKSRVLVIGGGIVGQGMDVLLNDPAIQLIETDASIGPRTQLICDGHDLPFKDGTIDCVIAQAVLEHVLDPQRVVDEMRRVLADQGLVYSDTPMMVQVHGREFDFTRFTHLGHRRLFRRFREISSGITCGPGMALGWSLRYFLLSFFSSRPLRAVVSGFSRLAFCWLKYFDHLLVNRQSAYDAALAFFFLGEKSQETLSDRELIRSYRGGF